MLDMNTMAGMQGAPGYGETDTQRADAIDENIVDIHTNNKFSSGYVQGFGGAQPASDQNIPQELQNLPQEMEALASFKDKSPFTLTGWSMKESEYKSNIQAYLNRIDATQRDSFAPLDKLISGSLDGFDLHVLVLKNMTDLSKHDASSIQGLVIFNKESKQS